MKLPLSLFLSIVKDFKELQLTPIEIGGREEAYQCSVLTHDGYCLGTGFDSDPEAAKLKSLMESIERQSVADLARSSYASEFLLDEHPSTCGFAFGLDTDTTIERAIAEAVERWLRSTWIDSQYKLLEIEISMKGLSKIEGWLANHFQSLRVFEHNTAIDYAGSVMPVKSIILVGYTASGAFVGSRSYVHKKPELLHALVEAWRHLKLSNYSGNFFQDEIKPIKFFAENKDSANQQISLAQKLHIPMPRLRLVRKVPTSSSIIKGYRALCEDFIGWHETNFNRFVY